MKFMTLFQNVDNYQILNDGNINILKDIHNRTITDFVPPDFREQNSELFVTTVSVRELIAGVTS